MSCVKRACVAREIAPDPHGGRQHQTTAVVECLFSLQQYLDWECTDIGTPQIAERSNPTIAVILTSWQIPKIEHLVTGLFIAQLSGEEVAVVGNQRNDL